MSDAKQFKGAGDGSLAGGGTTATFERRKTKMGHISKRGDSYLRTLLIHGARVVLNAYDHKEDRRSRWQKDVTGISQRSPWRTKMHV
ncbi:TPA: transposase [Klebsiella pneumoniae]